MGAKRALRGTFLFAAGAGTAWLYLDKRRRNIARDKAASLARDAAATIDRTKDYAAGVAKAPRTRRPAACAARTASTTT